MTTKHQVKEGDIIAIPFDDQRVAAALILHVSKVFRNAILIGIYEQVFPSIDAIDLQTLGGPFIGVPNYTGKQMVRDGDWPVIGNSAALFAAATIPELRVVDTVYYKDTPVRLLSAEEEARYPVHTVAGKGYVEQTLQQHFGKR
ncbi:MAG TPA: Imm26 family immunity protein [Herpetosiphonaceae bacterium]